MKKLNERFLPEVLSYSLREPEFNLFLIGDLENYGMDSDNVAVYTSDDWKEGLFPYVILNYRNNIVFYSHTINFDAETVAAFLSGIPMKNLSGKKVLIERLIPFFKGLEIVPTYLSRLDRVVCPPENNFPGRRLTAEDVPSIVELLLQIEEFYTMKDKTEEENYSDVLESISHGGRMYGMFEHGKLAAVAGTTAENSVSAMVVSVATLPQYRGRGYATRLVSKLCKECLDGGMQFLCLFYHNPEAGAIYRKLGFKEIGEYAMVKSVDM